MTSRKNALVWRLVVPAVAAALSLSLVAQSSLHTPDEVLKQESYQTPPKELADAVLATRYLNVSLTNASPDKKWFVDEIGDGPVVMKTFAKPFHELGGLFVDYKANRARPLTVRNNIGIQLIPPRTDRRSRSSSRRARACRMRRGRPTASRSPSTCTARRRRTSGPPTPPPACRTR